MRRWTQAEFDGAVRDGGGWLRLGTGDFRAVEFGGAAMVDIGEGSVLGPGAQLGEMAHIGRGCVIGESCRFRGLARIGARCALGEDAHIGACSEIGAGARFEARCRIGAGTALGDGVELPEQSVVWGVPVDGRTLVKLEHARGDVMMAFRCVDGGVRVLSRGAVRTLERYEDFARRLALAQDGRDAQDGRIRLAEAALIRARMEAFAAACTK